VRHRPGQRREVPRGGEREDDQGERPWPPGAERQRQHGERDRDQPEPSDVLADARRDEKERDGGAEVRKEEVAQEPSGRDTPGDGQADQAERADGGGIGERERVTTPLGEGTPEQQLEEPDGQDGSRRLSAPDGSPAIEQDPGEDDTEEQERKRA